MSRNRSHARTIASVEVLEGRQLMAQSAFIHLGALTGKALVDFNHGLTPAADGWRSIDSISFNTSPGGKVSSFNISTKLPFLELTSGERFAEAEVALRGGNQKLQEELDFKSVSFQSATIGVYGDSPEETVSFDFGQVTHKFIG